MNRPGPTRPARPDRDLFDGFFSETIKDKKFFSEIFIQVLNLCYQNMESISLIVWKLLDFRQRSNFGYFQ